MSFTLGTSGAAVWRAGARVNSLAVASGAWLGNLSDEVEALICDTARYDVVTNFGSLTTQGKQIVQMIHSAYIAQHLVGYDPNAYTARTAETTMDLCENDIRRGLSLIGDGKIKTYLTVI